MKLRPVINWKRAVAYQRDNTGYTDFVKDNYWSQIIPEWQHFYGIPNFWYEMRYALSEKKKRPASFGFQNIVNTYEIR
jgi:hypothetical protein